VSEVISTRFEANASEFVREVNKAREGIKKLSATDLPLVQSEMDRGFVQAQKMSKGVDGLGAASKRGGANMLVLAQVADDAQYGFRGIANQIPQLALALGAGAGLAGVISLAALALYKLGVPLAKAMDLFGQFEAAAIQASNAVNVQLANYRQELVDLAAVNAEKEKNIAYTKAQELAIKNLSKDNPAEKAEKEISAAQQIAEALQKRIAAEAELARAQNKKGAVFEEKIKGAEKQQTDAVENAAIEKELQRRKKLTQEINDARAKVFAFDGNARQDIEGKKLNADAEALELEKKLLREKRNVAVAQAQIAAFEKKGLASGIGAAGLSGQKSVVEKGGAEIAATEKKLAEVRSRQAEIVALLEKAKSAVEAADQGYQKNLESNQAAIVALEQELILRGQIQAVEKETQKLAEQALADAEAKKKAEEAAKEAEKAAAQKGVRGDFTAELIALKLQAAGREKEAQALRDKVRLTKEAQQLAKEAGISEEQAGKLVLQKFQLEKALNKEKESGKKSEQRDGRSRLFKRGESAGGAFANTAQVGLSNSVIEKNVRIAEQRDAARRSNQKDKPTTQLDDILSVNKSLLNFWTTNIKAV
jgi:hypothetical protein